MEVPSGGPLYFRNGYFFFDGRSNMFRVVRPHFLFICTMHTALLYSGIPSALFTKYVQGSATRPPPSTHPTKSYRVKFFVSLRFNLYFFSISSS